MHKILIKKFFEFFTSAPRNHKIIPSAPLIPENDPTVLFITAGMHPLVPYLMGEIHPLGKRLVDVQKSMRTDDLEEVGDLWHFTFFEMLGNWSLGDYFKKEAISWSFDFLTNKKWLGFDPKKIYVSVFKGDKDAPRDQDSIKIWQKVFKKVNIKAEVGERIFLYPKAKNWWGPAGTTGPCGPDSEMFYDTGLALHNKSIHGPKCHINCNCGRFIEVWNDVFMEFNKKPDGTYEKLAQKNVDTGMGVERVVTLLEWINGKIKTPDPFLTELFENQRRLIIKLSGKNYDNQFQRSIRIILDHLRAATFIITDGVLPSNKERGYVLRRLIRRAIRHGYLLGIKDNFVTYLAQSFINDYQDFYLELKNNRDKTLKILALEETKFNNTLKRGLKEIEKYDKINGKIAFNLYQSFGFPLELTMEIAREKGQIVNQDIFKKEFAKHQELSRTATRGVFKGGLQDQSEKTTCLHTATHLLQQALRKVLGNHVYQKGSHITAERLRFDFFHPQKLSAEDIKKVENIVNEIIRQNLPVSMSIMDVKEAITSGALFIPGVKYPEKVKVYTIGSKNQKQIFSKEICGGPHVDFTGKLGKFKIIKEEALGQENRRIYAVLENINVAFNQPPAKKGG